MEYTQWASLSMLYHKRITCLNPCCNGIYSMSVFVSLFSIISQVLILVVMEYTQWVFSIVAQLRDDEGLNPCCNGIYSMSCSYSSS